MGIFSDPATLGLKIGLDAGSLRQRVIANNIANLNTPFFKKSTVQFEGLLKKALGQSPVEMSVTHPKHMRGRPDLLALKPEIRIKDEISMRQDGNNVDIDEEMTMLASNGIKYQAMARILSERYSHLGLVITGGRR